MKKINGFTLAEVLITLVIIGIIAAMTIPVLMNKTNEQETVVAVKKAYSILGQAYQRMIAENGEIYPQNLGSNCEEATQNFGDMITPFLSVQKKCGMTSDGDCWSTENGGIYKNFDGSDWLSWNGKSDFYKFQLSDGMSFAIDFNNYSYSHGEGALQYAFGTVYIDVNGAKGPNVCGKDVFAFYITKYGVIPFGTSLNTFSSSIFSTCRVSGKGCTAWVIAKGNMDYLRKDVSW